MKKFKYTAININKKKISGYFLAESEEELAQKLAEQGLYLTKSKTVNAKVNAFFSVTGKISVNELSAFCRQFSVMIDSGIPIINALETLKTQSYGNLLKSTLEFVYEDVKGGALLSSAIEKHKNVFPRFFCSMISVGEASGALNKILISLADYFETDANIKKRLNRRWRIP